MRYINLHAYTHSDCSSNPHKINVGVECIDYKSLNLDEIIESHKKD